MKTFKITLLAHGKKTTYTIKGTRIEQYTLTDFNYCVKVYRDKDVIFSLISTSDGSVAYQDISPQKKIKKQPAGVIDITSRLKEGKK